MECCIEGYSMLPVHLFFACLNCEFVSEDGICINAT